MKLKLGKTKFMLFNLTRKYDCVPNLKVNGTNLETKEEMKLLVLQLEIKYGYYGGKRIQ